MSTHADPALSHRRHWYAKLTGELFHVPVDDVSVWPEPRMPVITGGTVLIGAGGKTISGVGADVAETAPSKFVAVTTTTSLWCRSSAVGLYVVPVAPAMVVQLAPARSHCFHW